MNYEKQKEWHKKNVSVLGREEGYIAVAACQRCS